eukprot:15324269-Ditylum_brightwellii.AAC.1
MKLVEKISNDINMTFGLDKCAVLTFKNCRYSTTNILPEIPKLDDDLNKGYQCLGIKVTPSRSTYPKSKKSLKPSCWETP